MKGKHILGFIITILILLGLTKCNSNDSIGHARQSDQNTYNVSIYKIQTDDGDFVLKGSTNAPDGSKILAQTDDDKTANVASSSDDDDYAKVKKHKFIIRLTASDLTEKDIKKGLKIKTKILAIRKYSSSYEDFILTKEVQKMMAKQVTPITLTINGKIANYYKDDEDTTDDNSDTEDENDEDSNNEDLDNNTNDDSDEENIEDEFDINTDEESDNENAEDDTDNETDTDKIYTGDVNKIIGDKNTGKYHVPGQAGYYINKENVIYFNSEKEAQDAGFIKSKR